MNKLVNKILREAEDSSDDFFQSKHVNKRKEDIKREYEKKKREARYKLIKGLNNIKIALKSRNWESETERYFLILFSRLYVDKKFFENAFHCEYYLLNKHDKVVCLYNIKYDEFYVDNDSIWKKFEDIFFMRYTEIQAFMNKMLEKHFKLYDILTKRL